MHTLHLCTADTGLPQMLCHGASCPRVSPRLLEFVWSYLESPLAVRLPQVRSGWVSPEGTALAMCFPLDPQCSTGLEVVWG